MKRVTIFILLLVLLTSFAASQEYYADVSFYIKDTGEAQISGTTNYPPFQQDLSQEFTSKVGKYWIVNITTPETDNFSSAAYSVSLPENAAINYIKSSMTSRIISESGRPVVKGSGENTSFSIIIQYSIDSSQNSVSFTTIAIVVGLALLLILILLFYRSIAFRGNPKRKNEVQNEAHEVKKEEKHDAASWYDKELLLDRQKEIVELIEKHGKPVTQKLLESQLNMPKSSLSRNIDSLVKKGIISKQRRGMVNVLIINPKKPEI